MNGLFLLILQISQLGIQVTSTYFTLSTLKIKQQRFSGSKLVYLETAEELQFRIGKLCKPSASLESKGGEYPFIKELNKSGGIVLTKVHGRKIRVPSDGFSLAAERGSLLLPGSEEIFLLPAELCRLAPRNVPESPSPYWLPSSTLNEVSFTHFHSGYSLNVPPLSKASIPIRLV